MKSRTVRIPSKEAGGHGRAAAKDGEGGCGPQEEDGIDGGDVDALVVEVDDEKEAEAAPGEVVFGGAARFLR